MDELLNDNLLGGDDRTGAGGGDKAESKGKKKKKKKKKKMKANEGTSDPAT